MTLTIDQLCVLKEGARHALERYEAAAAINTDPQVKAYWQTEAQTATGLLALLKDAIRVDVESARLTE